MSKLIFLKLGGSLITDKERPRTPRLDTLRDLSTQIAAARARDPNLLLLIGHGSGSFGHVVAKKYATRDGLQPLNYSIITVAALDEPWISQFLTEIQPALQRLAGTDLMMASKGDFPFE